MSGGILYWREPLWLGASLLPLLLLLAAQLRQRHTLAQLADPHLLPWVRAGAVDRPKRRARRLLIAAWVLFCVALAGPRTPQIIPPQLLPPAASVVVVVDFSASMNAVDIQASRLQQVRQQLQSWLTAAPAALRLGLVVYAGNAHVLIKPGDDHSLLQHFAEQLVDIRLPTLGNNLAQASQLASDLLEDAESASFLVLFSDGDLDDDARAAAAQVLSESVDAQLLVIGVGGSEAVSVPAHDGQRWQIDGEQVVSRRDARWLQQLATSVDGEYRSLESIGDLSLSALLNLPTPRIAAVDQHRVLWDEWFAVPLLSGVLLMLLGLSGRHNTHAARPLMLVVLLAGGMLNVDSKLDAAEAALTYAALFGDGVDCYRVADYDCALQAFAQAAWLAPDVRSRGRAAFNLGNSHFYRGEYAEASVAFTQAGKLGISKQLVQRNLAYADSLAAAVRQRIADIAETERRAEWRMAARGLPDKFEDKLAEGRYLSRPKLSQPILHSLSPAQLNQLIDHGIGRLRGAGNGQSSTFSTRQWVASPQPRTPENTAGLFNQLLPMEMGLPVTPDEPYRLEGQRPW